MYQNPNHTTIVGSPCFQPVGIVEHLRSTLEQLSGHRRYCGVLHIPGLSARPIPRYGRSSISIAPSL